MEKLADLRKEFTEWSKTLTEAMAREEAARQENQSLRAERDVLEQHLNHAVTVLSKFKTKVNELTQNYADIASVIDTKNTMAEKITHLQDEFRAADQEHCRQVEALKEEIKACKVEAERRVEEAVQQEREKAERAATVAAGTLQEREEQLGSLRRQLEEERLAHSQAMADQQRKLHEEQEKLRGRLAQMQQTINSRTLSDLDLLASKLQATRTEFEDKLSERDIQLVETREELQKAQDTLRHQQLLSVMRGVATSDSTTTTATTATASPTPSNHEVTTEEESDVDVGVTSEPEAKKTRTAHNRTQPVSPSAPPSTPTTHTLSDSPPSTPVVQSPPNQHLTAYTQPVLLPTLRASRSQAKTSPESSTRHPTGTPCPPVKPSHSSAKLQPLPKTTHSVTRTPTLSNSPYRGPHRPMPAKRRSLFSGKSLLMEDH